jgi:hypothetical protein
VPIWRAPGDVACRGEDTALFYKGEWESAEERLARTEKATGLCLGCRWRQECLEAAMAEERAGGARYGIRGALAPEERKNLQVSRTMKARKARDRVAGKPAA